MAVLRESDVNSSLEILLSSPVSILRHITCITKNSENYGSPVKSLVVLKELPEGLQEEAELPEEGFAYVDGEKTSLVYLNSM